MSSNKFGSVQSKKELRKKLSKLKRFGIYNPTSSDLTPWRERQINSLYSKYERELESGDYAFAKFPKYTEKRLERKSSALNLKSTKTGVFIHKDGQRKAKIQFNRKLQEYEIALSGKAKYGKRAGTKITTYIPLSPIDALETELRRMRNEAKTHSIKKNEYLRIRVTETGNDGFSNKIFSDFAELEKYLEGYKKSATQRIAFYRHISIEKVTVQQHRQDVKAKYPQKRKVDKKGRNV